MFCPNCKAPINESDLFCPSCGAQIPLPVKPEPIPENAAEAESLGTETEALNDRAEEVVSEAAAGFVPEAWAGDAGAPAPESEPGAVPADGTAPEVMGEKKKSALKPVLIGLGGLLVVAALVFGIVKLLGGKRSNSVLRAAENTYHELTDYLSELPNLKTMLDISDKLREQQKCAGEFSVQVDSSEFSVEIGGDFKSDMKAKRGQTLFNIKIDQISEPIDLGFFLDEENMMISSSTLLSEGEALSIPTKELGTKWNQSALAELTGLTLPEEFSLNLYPDGAQAADLDAMMTSAYGEQWEKFAETIRLVKYDGTPHFTDGTVKTVTWDSELLKPMYEQAKQEVEDMEDLYDAALSAGKPVVRQTLSRNVNGMPMIDYNRMIPSFIIYALGEYDESGAELQLRLNKKDAITGVYAVHEDEYVEIRLDGEKNPWEDIVMIEGSFYEIDGETREMAFGGEAALRIENRQLVAEFYDIQTDSDTPEEDRKELEGKLVYDDATGRIAAYDEDGNDIFAEEEVELIVKPDNGRITFRAGFLFNWDIEIRMDFSSGELSDPIEASFSKVQNLLELNERKLEGLVMRIAMKLQKLIPEGAID